MFEFGLTPTINKPRDHKDFATDKIITNCTFKSDFKSAIN